LNWFPVRHFPLEQDLAKLSGYLRSRGLMHRIAEDQGQQLLEVTDAEVIPALNQFLDDFLSGKVELEATAAARVPTNAQQLPSLVDQMRTAPVVVALIALSVLGTLVWSTEAGQVYFHYFSFQNFTRTELIPLFDSYAQREVWRLITPVFLHAGLFHVLFNSMWMWDLGRRVEYLLGPKHFIIFFLITGIASNAAQFLWNPSPFFGGMSGVVYALVGFIAVRQRLAPHPLMAVSPALLGFMLFWLVLCMTGVVDYFMSGSVANAAHFGGLVAGAVYALVTKGMYKQQETSTDFKQ
jgi:GlpG protein